VKSYDIEELIEFVPQPGGALAIVAKRAVMEVVYTWPNGREEVRYRRPRGSPDALDFEEQVKALQQRHGKACPYSIRYQ
jgi:hypothetical protein